MKRWLSIDRLRLGGLVLTASFASVACASSNAVRTALHGDLATLKRDIRAEQSSGSLDRSRVEDLAAAVAGREIRSAKGPLAVTRIRSARACVAPLLPVLRDRARRSDDGGAEAALVLFERNELRAERLLGQYAEASSGAWRAVAARAALDKPHSALRRKFMQDPDERARRAALHAAYSAADPADLTELLETARLDPDALSRALAVRAAGAIGGPPAVLGLDDVWGRASEELRITIVDGWSSPKSYAAGGQERLLKAAQSMAGLPSVAAAVALSRKSDAASALGVTILARAVREGTDTERRLAIQVAPLSDRDVRTALDAAARDGDPQIQVAALSRLMDDDKSRSRAMARLKPLTKRKDSVALQAEGALASAGDVSVQPNLVEQLQQPNPDGRRLAALSLIKLGDYAHAAQALADDDPDVRADVACSVLSTREQ